MSQLACPLCGRYVSLSHFDPSRFEPDIFAANMRGLGRGKGFQVSEQFSVLGEPEITGPIAVRCHEILALIEGEKPPQEDETLIINAELEEWRTEAFNERRKRVDIYTRLAELEEESTSWRRAASKYQRALDERDRELVGTKKEVNRLRSMVAGFVAEVGSLKLKIDKYESLEDDEEEMYEILDRINASANVDFMYLSDAVDFLSEARARFKET